jgi:hypothetical protein
MGIPSHIAENLSKGTSQVTVEEFIARDEKESAELQRSIITLRKTDPICVALRITSVMKLEANRVKKLMEMLGYSESQAKRLDYFVNNMVEVISTEAKAAAWIADETFYVDDGVNDWPWSEFGAYGWKGQGGGDFKTDPENSSRWVRVDIEKKYPVLRHIAEAQLREDFDEKA